MSRKLNQYEQEYANKILREIDEYEKKHEKMSQEKKAYFIYRKMGEIYTYKENFFLYPEELNMTEYLEKSNISKDGISKDGHGICGDINEGCVIVMKSAGIDAFLYYWNAENPLSHVDSGFKVNDKYYYFDLRADLYRIQTGMRTDSFGLSQNELYDMLYDENYLENRIIFLSKMNIQNHGAKFTGISKKQLYEWDTDFNFTYHGLYTDDVFEMLKKETMDQKHCEKFFGTSKPDELAQRKFEFIMKYIGIAKNNRFRQIGTVEAASYYTKLLYSLFSFDEFKKYIVSCTGFTKVNNTRIMKKIAVIKKDTENVFYLYNPKEEIYEEVNPKDLINAGIMYNSSITNSSRPISEFIDSLKTDHKRLFSDSR